MDISILFLLYVFAFGGFIIVTLKDLHVFNAGTPNLTPKGTIKLYWHKNAFQILSCVVVVLIFVLILWYGELDKVISIFVGNVTEGSVKLTAVFIGALSSSIGIYLRKTKSPAEIKVSDEEIKKLNLETKSENNG